MTPSVSVAERPVLGITVVVMDFVGSSDDALVQVLQANQYHHDHGIGQRLAVAVLLELKVAEMAGRGRLKKVRGSWGRKWEGGWCERIRTNLGTTAPCTRSSAIVGAMPRASFKANGVPHLRHWLSGLVLAAARSSCGDGSQAEPAGTRGLPFAVRALDALLKCNPQGPPPRRGRWPQ